ncbi:MAG: M14 family zinc carboxypeptidase, partial [Calditrichia bacterium]
DNGVYFESGTDGVDLNRNYGYQWGYNNSGSSPNPGSSTYRGPNAFSEAETSVLRDFCNQHQFMTAFNYHTYSNLLIHPWAYNDSHTPDHIYFQTFGQDMVRFNGYTLGTPSQTVGYSVNGDSNDWMYGEQSTKPKIIAFTPEVGSSSDGFWPPTSRIIPLAQENLYPNLLLTAIAGANPQVYDYQVRAYGQNNFPDPGETVEVLPAVTNYGLQPSGSFSLQLLPRESHVQLLNGLADFPGLNTFDSLQATVPWKFQINYNTPVGTSLHFDVHFYENGTLFKTDSLVMTVGTPVISFQDLASNGMANWAVGGSGIQWGTTALQSHTPGRSFTDSPTGNYSDNCNTWMRSQPIDLTNLSSPVLDFWTKWNIESGWDFGFVEISTNNGATWTHLVGQYMSSGSGSGVQSAGLHGYDGSQSSWVEEKIDLSAYAGNTVLLRFRLASDGAVNEDGWFVDDVTIHSVDPNSNVPPYISQVTQLNQQIYNGAAYPVNAHVQDEQSQLQVSLFYSQDNGASYSEVIMNGTPPAYNGNIPALAPNTQVLYYVQATDSAGAWSRFPYNAPEGTLQLNILAAGPALSVEPAALNFNVPQFSNRRLPLKLKNPGNQAVTFQITDQNISAAANKNQAPRPQWAWLPLKEKIQQQISRSLSTGKLQGIAQTPPDPASPLNRAVIITDSSGDTNLPSSDIISVEFSESLLNYTLSITLAAPPDSGSLGTISFDTDQNFATGAYPAPLGFGLGNFDVGSEYEVIFDFGNLLGDSLPIPPSAFVLSAGDSSIVGLPSPLVFNGSTVSVNLFKALFPVFDANMNVSAGIININSLALPDFAPDFGHGLVGNELGSSWIAVTDSAMHSAYPFSGTLQPGDSAIVYVKVAAAYPMG